MKRGIKRFGIKIYHFDRTQESESERRQRSCGTKERLTKGQAESRVSSLEHKNKTPYDAYRCQYCVKIDPDVCYHVGHSTRFYNLVEKRIYG